MKRIINKNTKKKMVFFAAAIAVMGMCVGCGDNKTVNEAAPAETSNEATTPAEASSETAAEAEATELVTYEFETFDNVKVVVDENSIIAQEPSEDPESSELVSDAARGNVIAPGRDFIYLEDDEYYYVADLSRQLITVADKSMAATAVSNDDELGENPGSFDTDLWSITYDTDKWYGYINDEGNTVINYLGECAGTSLIEITEVDVATAKEAVAILEEKKGKELTVVDALEGEAYTCNAYAADEVYESGLYIADFYTIYEHNGKVIIVEEFVTHDDDDARAEALANEFLEVKEALVLK